MPFAASISLNSLNGTNGFQINAEGAGNQIATVVGSAGDINGDGFEDFIISAVGLGGSGSNRAGGAYVIFGNGTYPTTFNLSSLNGANGFQISGATGNYAGTSVSAAGDFNNDGIDDLIIGAARDTQGGSAYVLYGKNTAVSGNFAADIATSSLTGSAGVKLIGPSGGQHNTGSEVDYGDFNGDGIDDLIVGAGSFGGGYEGRVYVVFGQQGGVAGPVTLSALNGTNGFTIDNSGTHGNIGYHVDNAGDINGDGIDDIIIGASPYSNGYSSPPMVFVIYGKNTAVNGNFASTVTTAQATGAAGFTIGGVTNGGLGFMVRKAGDINDDGHDDFMISASGVVYVVFGKNGNFADMTQADLNALNGTNGFKITGSGIGGDVGEALGDVNGDGIDDLAIGDYFADNGGTNTGSMYIVFGKTNWSSTPTLAITALNGTNGFRIDGEAAEDRLIGIGSGDINGDGAMDVIVGTHQSDVVGAYSGTAWVVYGLPGVVNLGGTPGDDDYAGGGLDDTLSGLGGNDILRGNDGNDVLDGGDLSDQLFGGNGADDLIGGGGGDIMYGDAGDDELDGGDGNDKLFGGTGADTLNGGAGNDRMDGEANVDTLRGGAGNDTLDGGLGADIMYGGTDNDTYIVDDALDQTNENANEGYDIVRTTLSWTLATNVEALELQGSTNASGTGNSAANRLDGNAGNNALSGLAGVDTINGNDGDDIIIGGEGNDLLRGGAGADTFRVAHAFGGVLETDQIYDFSDAEGDRMDFSGAYAGTFQIVSAFTHSAGQMTLTFASGITTVKLDVDGNGVAEYQVKINGDVTGDTGSWLL